MVKHKDINKTADFFTEENLKALRIKYTPEPGELDFLHGDFALLVVDVQEEYCDPENKSERGNDETVMIAKRIANLAPAFRKAGVPVYAIYYSFGDKPVEDIDFYQFKPEPEDTLVSKMQTSAFQFTSLSRQLNEAGRNKLLICGFNYNACVRKTAIDAVKQGFDVTVLANLTGNDSPNWLDDVPYCTKTMKDAGVKFRPAIKVLRGIKAAQNPRCTTPG